MTLRQITPSTVLMAHLQKYVLFYKQDPVAFLVNDRLSYNESISKRAFKQIVHAFPNHGVGYLNGVAYNDKHSATPLNPRDFFDRYSSIVW